MQTKIIICKLHIYWFFTIIKIRNYKNEICNIIFAELTGGNFPTIRSFVRKIVIFLFVTRKYRSTEGVPCSHYRSCCTHGAPFIIARVAPTVFHSLSLVLHPRCSIHYRSCCTHGAPFLSLVFYIRGFLVLNVSVAIVRCSVTLLVLFRVIRAGVTLCYMILFSVTRY